MINHSQQCVTMIEMVFPDQTNHYGTLFGGHALRLMDKARLPSSRLRAMHGEPS